LREFRVATAAGGVRWVLSRGKVFCDATGRPLRMLGVNMDITDRKALEASIVEDKERFRAIFEQTAIGVGYVVVTQHFHMANAKLREMFGFSHGEMMQRTVLDLVHPDDRPAMAAIRDETLATGSAVMHGEARFVRRDGSSFWGEMSAALVHPGDTKPELVVLIRDISVRREAQAVAKRAVEEMKAAMHAADAANHAKTSFIANMSHEIRTPLTAILGFSELLGDAAASEEQRRKYVATIVRNGQALSRLINDILDLSKVEASRLDVVRGREDVRALVEHLRATAAALVGGRKVSLDFQCDASIPEAVVVDGPKLEQILTNVVANAVKFTHEGLVALDARLERLEGGACLVVRVVDTGIGMTDEQKASVFQPFFQGDASMTRRYGGTGLGLTLARRLAQLLGGDLHLESSERGGGSTFVATIPVVIADDGLGPDDAPSGVKPSTSSSALHERLRGVRVLLVEDSPDSRDYFVQVLELAGVEVEVAANGLEAVAKGRDDFALILMDVQMPLLDGIAATERLRELGCRTPIVALTAHALAGERERCLHAGCNAHVTKPILPDALLSLVDGIVTSGGRR
jgi:PAS domain S-box-containing protein